MVKEDGQPFLSKYVSDHMNRLQKKGFQWEDEPFEILIQKYPGCKSSLNWWCNNNKSSFKNRNERENEGSSSFDISRYKWLKEFIISNPPQFKISPSCCKWSKKEVVKKILKEGNYQLSITGVRKAEGGIRQNAYKNCYTVHENEISYYRPLFWFTKEDKQVFEKLFDIKHSDCYCVYGFPRTGCSCCPYAGWNTLVHELQVTHRYEPNLYTAVSNVFADSYSYTQEYMKFRKKMNHPGRKGLFE